MKKSTLNVIKAYKNDFNLMKTIAQTKKYRRKSITLEARKIKLKKMLKEIDNETKLNNDPARQILVQNNTNFHNEYELFNKRGNNKDTKTIFKDLVKLYKLKGYRIPNFSINNHNLFKINPLLEVNTDIISTGFLVNQIAKKNDDSEKTIRYLKKLGIMLSSLMSSESDTQRDLLKKLKLPKIRIALNEEDTIEELKKKIEILNELINTNALAQFDEYKKRRGKSISRQSSLASISSSTNRYLNSKNRTRMKRGQSNYNNRGFNLGKINKTNNFFKERKNSNESNVSNTSYITNNMGTKFNKDRSTTTVYKIFSYNDKNPKNVFPKTTKNTTIPKIDFQRTNKKRSSDRSILSTTENMRTSRRLNNLNSMLNYNKNNLPINHAFSSNKINSFFLHPNQPKQNNFLQLNINSNQNNKNTTRYPLFIKTQSNSESNNNNSNLSEEFLSDLKSPRDINKYISFKDASKREISYPYTSRNEFINFAFNKFTKRSAQNAEKYIKNYLTCIKGYDYEQIETFVNEIYDKNLKNNIKELEKQITDSDLYSKTERLYLNSHLIKRIKPLLNNLGEKDKTICKLEQNLTSAVTNK